MHIMAFGCRLMDSGCITRHGEFSCVGDICQEAIYRNHFLIRKLGACGEAVSQLLEIKGEWELQLNLPADGCNPCASSHRKPSASKEWRQNLGGSSSFNQQQRRGYGPTTHVSVNYRAFSDQLTTIRCAAMDTAPR
jgi:hypothetical protein